MTHFQSMIPAVKLLGLTSSTALTTYIASFSLALVPSLKAAPVSEVDMAKQWNHAFVMGRSTSPPIAISCSSCFAFLAYQSRHIPSSLPITPFRLYTAAAVIVPCIVPYTLATMQPTIERMVAKAEEKADAPSGGEMKALLEKWKGQNMNRAYITGLATVLGAVAMVI